VGRAKKQAKRHLFRQTKLEALPDDPKTTLRHLRHLVILRTFSVMPQNWYIWDRL
jgi:hypothetical protein